MKIIYVKSCMECPYRRTNLSIGKPGIGIATCACGEDKLIKYMNWKPEKLDEMTFLLLEFPRDCPLEDQPIEEEPELCPPEPSLEEQIHALIKQSRKLTKEGRTEEAVKLFNQGLDLQQKLANKKFLDMFSEQVVTQCL